MARSKEQNPWLTLFTVSLGMLMAVVDISILNVALPSITAALDASVEEIQWTLIAYTLAMTGLIPIFGRVSDVIGRKRLFIAGLFFFALGSLLAALSHSIAGLIAARLVQAVGGALITTNTLAIVTDTFPQGQRGVAMGIQAILISGGAALGPTLGGFLVTHFDWEAVFYVNLPIGFVAIILAWWVLPPLRQHRVLEPIDWLGALLLMGGLTPLMLGLTMGGTWGWTSPASLAAILGGIVLLLGFSHREMQEEYPLIDLKLFSISEFRSGQLAGMFVTISMSGMMFLFPFYWQGVRGFSAQEAGLFMLPVPLTLMIVAPLAGRLSDLYGARGIASAGLITVMAGLYLVSRITVDMTVFHVLWRVTIFGLGLGLFMAPNNNAVMSVVPPQKRGVASGLLGTFRFIGQSLGVAYTGAIVAAVAGAGLAKGKGLPSPETLSTLAQNAEALHAFQAGFVRALSMAVLATLPFTAIGVVLSLLRGKDQSSS